MQVNPNGIRKIHVEVLHDLFRLETLSHHVLDDALTKSLAVLFLIYTVSSRDTVRELLAKEEPGSYKLFISSAFYQAFF